MCSMWNTQGGTATCRRMFHVEHFGSLYHNETVICLYSTLSFLAAILLVSFSTYSIIPRTDYHYFSFLQSTGYVCATAVSE
jgi:hypothetical protein